MKIALLFAIYKKGLTMQRRDKYLVMSNKESTLEWEQALRETLGVCHTVKQAYQIALFLGGISKPDSSYRKTLETIKVKGAYTINQVGGSQAATIVQVKHY
jgi:hypothetical protein